MGIPDTAYKTKTLSTPIPLTNQLDADGLLRISGITKLRFERHVREKEGVQILIDVLEEKTGLKVSSYNPDIGGLMLDDPTGVADFYLFGLMRDEMLFLSQKLGLEPQELMSRGLGNMWGRAKSKTKTKARKESREFQAELDVQRERSSGIPFESKESAKRPSIAIPRRNRPATPLEQ